MSAKSEVGKSSTILVGLVYERVIIIKLTFIQKLRAMTVFLLKKLELSSADINGLSSNQQPLNFGIRCGTPF